MKLVATALLAAATLAGARPALEKPNIVMLFGRRLPPALRHLMIRLRSMM